MKAHQTKKYSGFTLIELMIVIAIIAILMAYAIPAYRDYTVRTKAGEGLVVSLGVKSTVSEFWVSGGDISTLNSGNNAIPNAALITGNNVNQVEVSAGVIEVSFSNDPTLAGETMTLRPILPGTAGNPGTSLFWQCRSTLDNRYLPAECRAP